MTSLHIASQRIKDVALDSEPRLIDTDSVTHDAGAQIVDVVVGELISLVCSSWSRKCSTKTNYSKYCCGDRSSANFKRLGSEQTCSLAFAASVT